MVSDTWIIYLRKSRTDSPDESVEEVLAKHEQILQDWAERELGRKIPEDCIYREVGSGESIEDREEIKKVLARIEDPNVVGVLVVDPQRLSRGDLEDCGRLMNDFRYTKTLIGTPSMTYDLENKMERKFFQDELLRGRDYLEYIKEILLRGRIASVKRGCFIGRHAPYGYDKVKIGKDCTLEPNDKADVVRLIFYLYTVQDMPPGSIAKELNNRGIPGPTGGVWHKDTIRVMLRNIHYAGKVRFNNIREVTVVEDGQRRKKKMLQPKEEVIIAEGKHPAIIDAETWETAEKMVARNPRVKHEHPLKNPFSGILRCGACGHVLFIHPYKHSDDRYECRTRPRCYKSCKISELNAAILYALEKSELPELEERLKNDDGNARKIQQSLLEKLSKKLQEYRDQEEMQYELLETGKYTQDLFDRRNAALRAKMEECQSNIYQTKASMPEAVDYEERIVALKAAIASLKDPKATPTEQNKLLKTIVTKIEYTGSPSYHTDKKRGIGQNPFSIKVFLRL